MLINLLRVVGVVVFVGVVKQFSLQRSYQKIEQSQWTTASFDLPPEGSA